MLFRLLVSYLTFQQQKCISLIADNHMEDLENNGINHIFYG